MGDSWSDMGTLGNSLSALHSQMTYGLRNQVREQEQLQRQLAMVGTGLLHGLNNASLIDVSRRPVGFMSNLHIRDLVVTPIAFRPTAWDELVESVRDRFAVAFDALSCILTGR